MRTQSLRLPDHRNLRIGYRGTHGGDVMTPGELTAAINLHAQESQEDITALAEYSRRSIGQKFRKVAADIARQHEVSLETFYCTGSGECNEL